MKLAELKNLNPKKPGSWPWPAKIIAFVVMFVGVVVAGALLLWQDQWETLGKAKEEEGQLKETFLTKKRQAINLDLIKKQLNETQESLGALLKQLPSKSEMDALLTDINQAGLGRGLQFELFRPGVETVNGSFTEQPIVIKVTGNYDDIGKFSSDIAMLPRIVTLNDIAIANVASGGLSMDAVAKTYRYLDEAEIAAQNAQKKAKSAVKPGEPAQSGGHGGGAK
ncbi:MAG: type 4a pilus biogenesis protein PilO [Nitrosomonadales bacterium]|nr:type 4a pilus biogenesis protein PilO [Nitrosomonadales bacterium]